MKKVDTGGQGGRGPMFSLQFEPFTTAISTAFWAALSSKKLDEFGLQQKDIPILGSFLLGHRVGGEPVAPKLFLDETSFDVDRMFEKLNLKGMLRLFNTIDEYKQFDKMAWLSSVDLTEYGFFMIAFADLKKYRYHYHVCYPSAFSLSLPVQVKTIEDAGLYINLSAGETFRVHGETLVVRDASCRANVVNWNVRRLLLLNPEAKFLYCVRQNPQDSVTFEVIGRPSMSSMDLHRSGWERNAEGKIAGRLVDLSSSMDPLRLAEEAASLNLKLIKWRLLPTLDLAKMERTTCLLIGAGTLGCNVTRCLLAWGVRRISLVDNGRVSYSNPVRQSLFTHEDCLDGGRAKAETAAMRAKEICPYADITGESIAIPMPGHVIDNEEEFASACHRLEDLVKSHDVIFLLTDSRESRWMPALLGAALDKLVITVALGFDSFVAMRHGAKTSSIGCYFCHDVNSPSDTLSGRTLDQQCTVTRPGLSYMASATAVELMASILQHPLGKEAQPSAAISPAQQIPTGSSLLGLVPHQIRGFAPHFQNLLLSGERFSCCPACSTAVVNAYKEQPEEFLRRAIAEPDYLDQVSGLATLRKDEAIKVEAFLEDLQSEDEDDF